MAEFDIKRIIVLLIVFLLGFGIGIVGSENGVDVGGIPVFGLAIIIAFSIQVVAFIPAYKLQTEKFYDLTGAVTYSLCTLLIYLNAPNPDFRVSIMAIFVWIWSIRLGLFLFRRVLKAGEDVRFAELKKNPYSFLITWVVQGLWISFTAAAAWSAMSSTKRVDLEFIGILGIVLWILGFLIEVIADYQKSVFKSNPANKGKFISTGLWAWSRHPNYFGEILLWVGMALIALPVLSGLQYITLISPIFVILLLTKVSGVPLLEKLAEERWGGQEDYERYKAKTSVLILKPPKQA